MTRNSTLGILSGTFAVAVALMCSVGQAAIVEYMEKFDDDPVGQMPPGWVHTGETSNTSVSNLASVSPGNSFTIDHNGSSATFFAAQNRLTFPGFNLDANTPTFFWQMDFMVDFLGGGSEGFDFRIWSNSSQLDRGAFRIFKTGATTFAISTNTGTATTLNMDQWYNIKIEIDPTSSSAGATRWYLNGSNTPFFTQTWAGWAPTQMNNISVFDIRELKQSPGGTGSRMFIDNFVIAVPEPASAVLLGAGGLLVAVRRRRAR